MKIKAYQPLLALLFVSGLLQAQTTIPAGGLGDPATLTAPLTVEGDTTVNGTLTVQPEITSTSNVNNTPNGSGQIDPATDAVGPVSTTVNTKLGETVGDQTSATGGGATIQTNGDTNLSAATGTQTDITYSRLTTVEIYNADQGAVAGTPVPNSQMYFAAKPDTVNVGQFIPISPMFTTEALLQAWIDDPANDPETIYALNNDIGTQAPLANTGGNLNVDGATTTNGIDNGGEQITNLADGVADGDAATVGQVGTVQDALDQEIIDRTDADDALGVRIDDEIDDRTDADDALGVRIDDEIDDRTDADDALGVRIDDEIDDRTDADDALGVRIDDEIDDRTDADDALGVRIDDEIDDRTDADDALGVRIDDEIDDRTDADDALGVRIDDEIDDRTDADDALGVRIDDEETARIDADVILQDNINTEIQDRIDAVANEANIRSNADILLNNRITNETNRVNGEIVRLDNRIDNVKSNLESSIDKNSRGIAMVAAMTNTRVEAGKCHGVDFNLSNFRGETGFAFGYANRVNENVQVHGAIASTTDFDESVVRVGVSYQW